MKATSYFIGIQLRSEFLVDLYVDLQKELGDYAAALDFQNILSAHITLYYLSDTLPRDRLEEIRKVLRDFGSPIIHPHDFSYFGDITSPRLCYISAGEFRELENMHQALKNSFPEYIPVPDNAFTFIPHITLFKIRDMEVFLYKREKIEEILRIHLSKIQEKDLFESFEIFQVHSGFHPEIQIKI